MDGVETQKLQTVCEEYNDMTGLQPSELPEWLRVRLVPWLHDTFPVSPRQRVELERLGIMLKD